MKVLIDENLPHELRNELPGHDCYTTAYMKWAGIVNGELLKLALDAGFDVLVTTDRGLEYEQNLAMMPVEVLIIRVKRNTTRFLRPVLPDVLLALSNLRPGQLVKIPAP